MDVTWNAPSALYALWLLPVLAGVVWLAHRHRARAARAFADAPMRTRLFPPASGPRAVLRGGLLLAAFAACVLALARPQWGLKIETVTRQGADLFVLLDVSRSMLSRDVAPSRLERAKADVRDLLPRLRGERVGLIAFAGKAVVSCPLTTDHAFFRTVLGSLGPDSAPRGGTAIGDAIRKALSALPPDAERDRALLLITDGEDHASFPAEAAALASERNVRIFTVGLGDPVEGARVPVTDEHGNRVFLEYEGEQVWSRMDESLLRKLALETGGAYVPARTRAYDLGAIYDQHLAKLAGGEGRQERRERRPERFQFFLALGLLAFALRAWLRPWARPAVLLALLALAAPAAHADDRVDRALALFRDGDREAARDLLEKASEEAPDDPLLAYDHGAVLQALGDRDDAKARYLVATRGDDARVAARACVNLGLLSVDDAREAFGGPPEDAKGEQRTKGVEAIRRALTHFRAALDRGDPDGIARRNLERLKLWLARTREEWKRRDDQEKAQEKKKPEESLLEDLGKLRDDQRALRSDDKATADAQRGLIARFDDIGKRLTGKVGDQARGQANDGLTEALAAIRAAMDHAAKTLDGGGAGAKDAQTAAFLWLDQLWNAVAPFDAQLKQAITTCRAGIAGTEAQADDRYLPEQPARVASSAVVLDAKAQDALARIRQNETQTKSGAPGGAPGAPPPGAPGPPLPPKAACEKAIEHAPAIEKLCKEASSDLEAKRFDPALEKQREALRLLEEIAHELPKDQQRQQKQQNGDEQKRDQEKDQQQQDQQQQQQGKEKQQDQQKAGQQEQQAQQQSREGPTPDEVDALLRKAEEREREYLERKREERRAAAAKAGKVERDW